MGYFNQNSLGQITAIETTILNDVETAVPVVLVTTLGGFFEFPGICTFFILLLTGEWGLSHCLEL